MSTSDLKLNLPDEILNRMFPHQKEGVEWLYGLRSYSPGGN
jgi:SNF2 family DNA or RNA helicase